MRLRLICGLVAVLACLATAHDRTVPPADDQRQHLEEETEGDDVHDDGDDFVPHEEDSQLNRGAFIQRPNKTSIDTVYIGNEEVDEDRGRPDSISFIDKGFKDRQSFSCPRVKTDLVTGTSVGTLSPEDVQIIAAMGDEVATGEGLFPKTRIEFRGAAFPIGGDASIDGLVTIPNILREFIQREPIGVSHGMGHRDELPRQQLNMAAGKASTADLPKQANELVKRIERLRDVDVRNTWMMVIVTIGTGDFCNRCSAPNGEAVKAALDILNRGIHKAFVVVVGPLHVSLSTNQQKNLLKEMCQCLKDKPELYMQKLMKEWEVALRDVQDYTLTVQRDTFGVFVLPFLTITSRYPASLFIANQTLLNRRGHNYAAKWLWNRLIAGPMYNLSSAILSSDAYFCPSVGCPYFRNEQNFQYCPLLRHLDATKEQLEDLTTGNGKRRREQRTLYLTAAIVCGIAFMTATTGCIVFYYLSKRQTHGRFDMAPIIQDGAYVSSKNRVNSQRLAVGSDGELLGAERPHVARTSTLHLFDKANRVVDSPSTEDD